MGSLYIVADYRHGRRGDDGLVNRAYTHTLCFLCSLLFHPLSLSLSPPPSPSHLLLPPFQLAQHFEISVGRRREPTEQYRTRRRPQRRAKTCASSGVSGCRVNCLPRTTKIFRPRTGCTFIYYYMIGISTQKRLFVVEVRVAVQTQCDKTTCDACLCHVL